MRYRTSIAVIATALLAAGFAQAAPVRNDERIENAEAACARAKHQYGVENRLTVPTETSCDIAGPKDSPDGYVVLALHSVRLECSEICSTNMGWFAVQRRSGRVFAWDVETGLGRVIGERH